MTLTAEWIDRGVNPQNPPNPNYPFGIDIDSSHGASATCSTTLRHPTPRCGYWKVSCDTCDQVVVVTTAGRADDPRSIKLACRQQS
jgi:hypothetical protein